MARIATTMAALAALLPSTAGFASGAKPPKRPNYLSFDGHSHIFGTLEWRGIVLSYLVASEDSRTALLLEQSRAQCALKASDYNRDTAPLDVCFYQWARKQYKINGCADGMCPLPYTELHSHLVKTAHDLVVEGFELAKPELDGTALGQAYGEGQAVFEVPRLEWGSLTLLPLMTCLEREMDEEELESTLEAMMTASLQVGFDSAYVAREVLRRAGMRRLLPAGADSYSPHCADGSCPTGKMMETLWAYLLQELLMHDIELVQWSHPICQLPVASCEAAFKGYPHEFPYFSGSDGNSCVRDCQLFESLHRVLIDPQTRLPATAGVALHFTPMFVSTLLGKLEPTSYQLFTPTGAISAFTPWDHAAELALARHLLETQPHFNGFDYASPERTVFTLTSPRLPAAGEHVSLTLAGQTLKEHLDTLINVSRSTGKPMAMHIHAGEGFGVYDYLGGGFKQDYWQDKCDLFSKQGCDWARASSNFGMDEKATDALCMEAAKPYTEQRPRPVLWTPNGAKPLHYGNARRNVLNVGAFMTEYRNTLAQRGWLDEFDERVNVFVGHAAHSDERGNALMAKNNVWADIILTGNLATGCFVPAAGPDSPTYYKIHNVPPTRFLERLHTVIDAKLAADLYAPSFLLHQPSQCATLATDGPGVEHSSSEQEPTVLDRIMEGNAASRLDKAAMVQNGYSISAWLSGKAPAAKTCLPVWA